MTGTIFDRPSDHEIRKFVQGKFNLEFFPEGYILLNRELATGYHPALEMLLAPQPADEVDIRLSIIAHYLGIVLNGAYTIEARSELCAIMSGRLELIREYPLSQSIQPYSEGSLGPIGGTPINQRIEAAEKDFPTELYVGESSGSISPDIQQRINSQNAGSGGGDSQPDDDSLASLVQPE